MKLIVIVKNNNLMEENQEGLRGLPGGVMEMETASSPEKIFRFEEKEKVGTISLEDISHSYMVRDAKGEPPRTRPIQSWELIEQIHNILGKNNIEFEQEPVWVQKSDSSQILTTPEKEIYNDKNTPLNKWLFNRLITRINLKHDLDVAGEHGRNTSIAIGYHRMGIQIAWGVNVQICQNMCIFGGNSINTYGNDKVPFNNQMDVLESWIMKFDEKYQNDVKIIENMQDHRVGNADDLDRLVGKMYKLAIHNIYSKEKSCIAPMNTYQLSPFVQGMSELEDDANVWDLYNIGTNVLKPGNIDLIDIWDGNKAWGNFVIDEYKLN